MYRTDHKSNLAARMGRWSASHWKTATFGWLAFVVVAFAMSSLVGIKSPDPSATGPGQSGRMDKILNAGFKQPAGESVLIQSRSLRTDDPAFAAAIRDVVTRLSAMTAVQHVRRGEIAKDGRAALVDFEIRGDRTKAVDKIKPVVARVAEVQQAHPQLFIGEFGQASAVDGTNTAFNNDLAKAGTLSLPITMVILLVAFGALVAAGIPLLLGLTAVFATFGVLALPSHLIPIANEAPALVLLVGLAVGVDYAMFYLKRERQERAAGRSEHAALEAAAATSGHSVLISGLTVMVAMSGMFLIGDPSFASFGLATMVVVALAVLGSLTVLPALLSRLGDKVDRLRVPFVGRQRSGDGESRFWSAIVDRVLRRPILSAMLACGLLLGLAAPALQLHLGYIGPDTLPKSMPVVQAYDRMQQAFPGTAIPATVVVKAPNVNAPQVRAAIAQLERRAHASGRSHGPVTVDVNNDATVANITVPIDGTGADAVSNAALAALRTDIVPRTVGAVPNTEAGVTGWTAEWKDAVDLTKSKLPIVVGFVLVLAFGLMLFAFRSLVIAITAILLNLLSVTAAYGVMVLVFQKGIGKGLLGFTSTAGISAIVPLLLFVILFGLSMDYHVFMLSRIRESHDGGASTEDAISHGIKSTAGVVTSAAVVMVTVFAIFGTLSMLFFKQFGVGLATAVLLDATIVRAVLLPATMKLLGERNWYLPRWLEWLPVPRRYDPEPDPEPEREIEAEPPAAKRKRVLTPSRVVGLVLIALVALGLGYVHMASADRPVSVPAGAKAGALTLKPCSYATAKGSYSADCGTLVVPENRADPHSRLIALPVTRIHARSAHPGAAIFHLSGGPGVTNMTFPEASRFAGKHDVVFVGYRGVDGSVRLDCPEVEAALAGSTDLVGEKSFRAYGSAFRSCAKRLTADGVDLAGYGVVQQADDLEAARTALGYGRIDLLSESAGTRTAMVYAWRYPKSIHRSVMTGVNPPGNFLWNTKATDEQIGRYTALCSEDAACGKRTNDLAGSLTRTAADIPDHWLFLPIKQGNVRLTSFFGLMESTSKSAPLSAPMTIDSWLSAAGGDASGFWFASLVADLQFPKAFAWGEYAAVASSDDGAARRYFSTPGDGSLARASTAFLWGGGRLADSWPAASGDAYSHAQRSNVPTLLIGGSLDLATPPQIATKELLPYLPHGRQVVLPGFGHTTSFWSEQPEAGTRLINAYLDRGTVDESLYKPQRVDFTPDVTLTALAKGIAGVMVGLALLVVLSLLWWMPRRVHKRGQFGRKASATLRSIYPIVLGLGGWFLGVLVVITTMPGTALDGELLGILSTATPIALGIYWAWVHREWSGSTKTAGLVAVFAGALLGGWLGFHAASDLLALLAAIAGATAGANLALIVLSMAWERSVGSRYARDAVPATAVAA
jgi:uncharacterized membrane protein YdfJ with MMPL/SSD domain/pimeloyl-ACP methyl ester carboxylesterase